MRQSSIFLLLCLSIFLFACGDDGAPPPPPPADTPQEAAVDEAAETASGSDIQLVVCLWPESGIRSNPGRGKDAKWITSMSFGETATFTGNSEEASDDRTYVELELLDGKKGWSNEYLFAVDAHRAVASGSIDIFKRPELTTISGKQFESGELFAVKEGDKEGWMEVFGFKKEKMGWVQSTSNSNSKFTTDELDVTVAIMYQQAMNEKTPMKQEERLKIIAESSTFKSSPLMAIVDEKLAELAQMTDLPANQLMVTTDELNVRSEPDTEEDNIQFQVSTGDVCNIVERGELVKIREMEDYWYLIEFNGQQGWIYGFFTSKKIAE
ncbi:MAG: SH3 domain-containing protein [Bacteroidota bacterium]